jgi:threonine dehydrogenase-like Zn-dependent dehydrogenase
VLLDTRPDRLALGRRMRASDVIHIHEETLPPDLEERFDLVFEAATRPGGSAAALRLARRGGSVVLEEITGSASPNLVSDTLPLKHLRVQGIFGASGGAWRWVVELFAARLLEPSPPVSHRFRLEDHAAAFATWRILPPVR